MFYRALISSIGIDSPSSRFKPSAIESLIPNTALRNALLADPPTKSILSSVDQCITFSRFSDAPFRVDASGLILVSATLIEDRHALACSVRLGIEARFLSQWVPVGFEPVLGLLDMARALIELLPSPSRELLFEVIPSNHHHALASNDPPTSSMLQWLAAVMGWSLQGGVPPFEGAEPLCGPVERLMIGGGDSRLALDAVTGLNRYGVPPRPRPEAVHFSSSTASAISDHGFMLCDMLRRDLLVAAYRRQVPMESLRATLTRGIGDLILRAVGLDKKDADVAVLPSGTDAEHLALLVAIANPEVESLVNVLVGPEESGRGVIIAAHGRRFDPLTHNGELTEVGAAIQDKCAVEVQSISIRDAAGLPRALDAVDDEFEATARSALERSSRILVHVLMSSKTGLSAPTPAAVDRVVSSAQERVDVVVDACQARLPLEQLGQLVRRGWMVQVSGSKFLTGPPFSGALIVPAEYRRRAAEVGRLLAAIRGISHQSDWTRPWADILNRHTFRSAGFGPPFRWLPALLEAWMFASLPEVLKRHLFHRFRTALLDLIAQSSFIKPFSISRLDTDSSGDHFLGLSILSFQVYAKHGDGIQRSMTEDECQKLFVYLNTDMSCFIPSLPRSQRGLSRLQVHVGQPVTINVAGGSACVLRLVLGARFFTFIGHAHPTAMEAALQSEIGDAERAIQKIELLANEWANIVAPGGPKATV